VTVSGIVDAALVLRLCGINKISFSIELMINAMGVWEELLINRN